MVTRTGTYYLLPKTYNYTQHYDKFAYTDLNIGVMGHCTYEVIPT